jgi:hypothetical protein
MEQPPSLLLIVRERLRAAMVDAYARNEREIAASCAALNCPHPYLALASDERLEVWWFNAFTSEDEQKAVESAYARNDALMARLAPLGERKAEFRESLSTTLTRYNREASGGATLQIAGARFVVVAPNQLETQTGAGVFEAADGQRFVVAPAPTRAAADRIAARLGPDTTLLAVRPEWSYAAAAWIAADPGFWSSSPVAAKPRGSEGIR